METWRDVIGYEGLYQVSDIGRVMNSNTGHILQPGISQGYYYVALYKDGIRKNKQVNRLVAEAFLFNKENYPLVHHKDEMKLNNRADNLEWRSYAYNNAYNDGIARRAEHQRGKTAWNKGKRMSETFRKNVSNGMKKYHQKKAKHTAD